MSKVKGQWVADNWQTDAAVGNGSTVIYSLSQTIAQVGSLQVYVNGILVSNYTYSAGAITFTTAPALAQNIRVRYIKRG